jgi:hypothetical protein
MSNGTSVQTVSVLLGPYQAAARASNFEVPLNILCENGNWAKFVIFLDDEHLIL